MGLIIPYSHTIHGTKPKYACTLCTMTWFAHERAKYLDHALHFHDHAELRQHSLQAQAPGIFDPHWEGGDVEWQDWIDRNNEERPEDWAKWMKTGLDK